MTDQALEITLGELLRQRGLSLATAESCTGGLVSHLITNVPGSSDYFPGGITAYANDVKMRLLGVAQATLIAYGAVSAETALDMARGIRNVLGADIGLSVTGIAGPGGDSDGKPVGLVWIGLSTPDGDIAHRFNWHGDRIANKEQSATQAIELVIDYLHSQGFNHAGNP
jgi:PncC family amidohydrolase